MQIVNNDYRKIAKMMKLRQSFHPHILNYRYVKCEKWTRGCHSEWSDHCPGYRYEANGSCCWAHSNNNLSRLGLTGEWATNFLELYRNDHDQSS